MAKADGCRHGVSRAQHMHKFDVLSTKMMEAEAQAMEQYNNIKGSTNNIPPVIDVLTNGGFTDPPRINLQK